MIRITRPLGSDRKWERLKIHLLAYAWNGLCTSWGSWLAVLPSGFKCLKTWLLILNIDSQYWFSTLQNQNGKGDLQKLTWKLIFQLYCNSVPQRFGLHKRTMSTNKKSLKLVGQCLLVTCYRLPSNAVEVHVTLTGHEALKINVQSV